MSDDYTPTTEQTRCAWCDTPAMGYAQYAGEPKPSCGAPHHGFEFKADPLLFDRWLVAHDAEVRAEQREKDAQIAREYGDASADDLAEGQYSDEFAEGYAYGRNRVVEAIVADIEAAAAIRAGGAS